MTQGFENAGFKCVAGIDSSKACIATHAKNFPNSLSICKDIRQVDPKTLKKNLNKKVKIIIGGPPCPTFSTIGHAKIMSIETNKRKHLRFLTMKEIFF